MKNLFCVIGFTLFSTIAFGKNVLVKQKLEGNPPTNCTYVITHTVTLSDGYVYTYTTTHETYATSLQDCMNKAQNYVDFLNG
jgi:hypothetical protein